MSEVLNARETRKNLHSQLLVTASAIALIGLAYGMSKAHAADGDSDHPLVWIELGGQLSRLDDGQMAFAPPLAAARPSIFTPSQEFERPPRYSLDEIGKISFKPGGSNWVLSASVQYGHTSSKKDINQQTSPLPNIIHYTVPGSAPKQSTQPAIAERFADTTARIDEHHFITDFQVGKDVGVGMFGGGNGSSVFGLGVRFAQFGSTSDFALKSDPDWKRLYKNLNYPPVVNNQKAVTASPYHINAASLRASRSFHGIGPSISWNASSPFAGDTKDGELLFDWGAKAALLFGRQKAAIHHQSSARYHPAHTQYGGKYNGQRHLVFHTSPPDHIRSRTVMVPNVGGFAGLTFRVGNFKMSAGYRADLFFGPMDGGIDTAKKENVGFYGPFASISVGIGGR
jgi:hypothetical protein